MNSAHHEQIALDTLECAKVIFGHHKIFYAFREKEFCRELFQAASAPDRLRDIRIPLLGSLGDSYEFAGKNLEAFTHFLPERSERPGTIRSPSTVPPLAGYCWRKDPGAPTAATLAFALLDLPVEYRPENFGERAPGYDAATPMAKAVFAQSGAELGRFMFPSLEEMANYYAGQARLAWARGDFSTWRRCVGYVLHYLADACVPHHVWGTLFLGHQAWENMCERFWLEHVNRIKIATGEAHGQLYADTVGKAVSCVKFKADNIADLIDEVADCTRARFGNQRELSECSNSEALVASVWAIAASVKALEILSS